MIETNKSPVVRMVVAVLAVTGAIALVGALGMTVMHTTMMGSGWGC